MQDLKIYWEKLSEREQKLSSIAAIVLVLYLFYALLYSPIMSSVTQKNRLLKEQKEVLYWMQGIRNQYTNTNNTVALSQEQILSTITKQLKVSNFKDFVYQLQQTRDGCIQLNFAVIPYTEFITWLNAFCIKYRVVVKQFSASAATTNGLVSIMVVFGQPADAVN